MAKQSSTAEEKVADAIRFIAASLQKQWDDGERSAAIDLNDLMDILCLIADEIDPE